MDNFFFYIFSFDGEYILNKNFFMKQTLVILRWSDSCSFSANGLLKNYKGGLKESTIASVDPFHAILVPNPK